MTEPAADVTDVTDVHRIPVATPFAVGPINCYLVDDDPLTIVDSGPNSATSLLSLETQLGGLGHSVEDIERIVITHQHMDHIGLVDILATRSGAEVCAIASLAPWLSDFSRSMDLDDAFAESVMIRNGIPADVRHALRAMSTLLRGWGAAAQVTTPLDDGAELRFANRVWEVHHRPGHSPSDTVFLDRASGDLFAGDHLIGHISSNPSMTRPLNADPWHVPEPSDRPQVLRMYIDSMIATRELPVRRVLPGHGDPVTDHVRLIDERLAMHERRADNIHRLIDERPSTAYEIAQSLWGTVAITQAYLTLSEVLGHADLLVSEGRIVEEEDGDVVRFASVTPPPAAPET